MEFCGHDGPKSGVLRLFFFIPHYGFLARWRMHCVNLVRVRLKATAVQEASGLRNFWSFCTKKAVSSNRKTVTKVAFQGNLFLCDCFLLSLRKQVYRREINCIVGVFHSRLSFPQGVAAADMRNAHSWP